MDWTSNVTVHQSAFPEATRARILESVQRGELDPSLLYGGLRQTSRWIELHHALSPAHKDPTCTQIYDQAFARAGELCQGNVVHLVSLACGDGTKDTRCLQALRTSGRTVIYTPADMSLEMVLTAERAATTALRGLQTTPLLCDLANCSILPAILKNFDPSGAERLILFLGTIHNYWPPDILRSIVYPLRSQDHLLLSANLARASDYDSALNRILPQYDNAPTREWLMGALAELTIMPDNGALTFSIPRAENMPSLKRIQANFTFAREKRVSFYGNVALFSAGQQLRLFSSYRFTAEHVREFLAQVRLTVVQEWTDSSGEEGLFLCRRAA
jgi:uncharacterized SAM-dependent methyltransferase